MAKFHRRIFSVMLIILLLWLNGFGCAMCCEKAITEAHCRNEASTATQQNSSVNAKSEAKIRCQKEPSEEEEMDCCKKSTGKHSASLGSLSTGQKR